MGLTPRPATPSDEGWLFDLHDAAHRGLVERAYGPWDDVQQRDFFAPLLTEFEVLVFENNGVPVASLFLGERDGDVWIELVEVEPSLQGRGVGTAVMSWAVERATSEGRGVLLQVHKVNTGAQRLYLREGFRQVDDNDTHFFLRHP
jgi:GNAT superfamily N-acetyltransferase